MHKILYTSQNDENVSSESDKYTLFRTVPFNALPHDASEISMDKRRATMPIDQVTS